MLIGDTPARSRLQGPALRAHPQPGHVPTSPCPQSPRGPPPTCGPLPAPSTGGGRPRGATPALTFFTLLSKSMLMLMLLLSAAACPDTPRLSRSRGCRDSAAALQTSAVPCGSRCLRTKAARQPIPASPAGPAANREPRPDKPRPSRRPARAPAEEAGEGRGEAGGEGCGAGRGGRRIN